MSKLLERIIKNSPTKMVSALNESTLFKDRDTISTEIPSRIVAMSFCEPRS